MSQNSNVSKMNVDKFHIFTDILPTKVCSYYFVYLYFSFILIMANIQIIWVAGLFHLLEKESRWKKLILNETTELNQPFDGDDNVFWLLLFTSRRDKSPLKHKISTNPTDQKFHQLMDWKYLSWYCNLLYLQMSALSTICNFSTFLRRNASNNKNVERKFPVSN